MNLTAALEMCKQSGYMVTSASEALFLMIMVLVCFGAIGVIIGFFIGDAV